MKQLLAITGLALILWPGASLAGDALPHTKAPKVLNAQGGYSPPKPKDGFRYPDCFCTDSQGNRIELGQTTCLQIGSTQVLARCKMSLNNPSWKRIQEGCPSV